MMTTEQILQKYGDAKNTPVSSVAGSMTSGQILQRYGSNETPVSPQIDKKSSLFKDALTVASNLAQIQGNIAVGALKGLGSTALGISELGNKTLGRLVGSDVSGTSQFIERQRQNILKPTGTAQNIGYGAEQIGEFFLPGGTVSKGAKAIEGVNAISKLGSLGKVANIAGKSALEASSMAGVTAAQGGSGKQVLENALLGGITAPIGGVFNSVKGKASDLLRQSAVKSMSVAMGATTKANKFLTEKVVPGLLEKNVVAGTRKGLLEKMSTAVKNAGEKMDVVLEGIPDNSPVNLSAVSNKLEEAKNAFIVTAQNGKKIIADPQAVSHIEGFQKILGQIGGEDAPFGSVRKLRQIWDEGVAKAGGFYGKTLSEGSLIDAQKTATNALREELVKGRPDLEKINKEFNFWANAQKVLKDTIERTSSQGTPLTKQIFRATGVAKGGLTGLGIAALGELLGSTAWRTVSAVTKNRIAEELAKNNMQNVINTITKLLGSQNSR